MPAAIIQVCVDPRLHHELLNVQVRSRLERLRLQADRIFLLGDVGGNPGSNTSNTLDLLAQSHEPVVLAAVLHHDDCYAAAYGMRHPLQASARALESLLRERHIACPVLTGNIYTATNEIVWTDEPRKIHEVLPFRMPRMLG
jgi:hypothetical protein